MRRRKGGKKGTAAVAKSGGEDLLQLQLVAPLFQFQQHEMCFGIVRTTNCFCRAPADLVPLVHWSCVRERQ